MLPIAWGSSFSQLLGKPFSKLRKLFRNGKRIERDFKKGDVMWMKNQVRIGGNVGTTDTHVLIIELKPSRIDIKDTVTIPYDEKWKKKDRKDLP
jgi:hypothetical protein